jgi:uncharacterized protein YrrD
VGSFLVVQGKWHIKNNSLSFNVIASLVKFRVIVANNGDLQELNKKKKT